MSGSASGAAVGEQCWSGEQLAAFGERRWPCAIRYRARSWTAADAAYGRLSRTSSASCTSACSAPPERWRRTRPSVPAYHAARAGDLLPAGRTAGRARPARARRAADCYADATGVLAADASAGRDRVRVRRGAQERCCRELLDLPCRVARRDRTSRRGHRLVDSGGRLAPVAARHPRLAGFRRLAETAWTTGRDGSCRGVRRSRGRRAAHRASRSSSTWRCEALRARIRSGLARRGRRRRRSGHWRSCGDVPAGAAPRSSTSWRSRLPRPERRRHRCAKVEPHVDPAPSTQHRQRGQHEHHRRRHRRNASADRADRTAPDPAAIRRLTSGQLPGSRGGEGARRPKTSAASQSGEPASRWPTTTAAKVAMVAGFTAVNPTITAYVRSARAGRGRRAVRRWLQPVTAAPEPVAGAPSSRRTAIDRTAARPTSSAAASNRSGVATAPIDPLDTGDPESGHQGVAPVCRRHAQRSGSSQLRTARARRAPRDSCRSPRSACATARPASRPASRSALTAVDRTPPIADDLLRASAVESDGARTLDEAHGRQHWPAGRAGATEFRERQAGRAAGFRKPPGSGSRRVPDGLPVRLRSPDSGRLPDLVLDTLDSSRPRTARGRLGHGTTGQ